MDTLPPPLIPRWGFHAPRNDIIRIPIDTRDKPVVTKVDAEPSGSPSDSPKKDEAPIFLKGNQQPNRLMGPNFQNFAAGASRGYFGGPILSVPGLKWQKAFYTRASGDICGLSPEDETVLPLPHNLQTIISSVAAMGNSIIQSGIWVGPRLFLSTLHMHEWKSGEPTKQECDELIESGKTFSVETEINSMLLLPGSPKVQLVAAHQDYDLGLFRLLDNYPPRTTWYEPDGLIEHDQAGQSGLSAGRKIACVGFSQKLHDDDRQRILYQAAIKLQHRLPQFWTLVEAMDLDEVVKAEARCFSPGLLDEAEFNDKNVLYGVSASLWKGNSGGPCIVLDGNEAGGILGLGKKVLQ